MPAASLAMRGSATCPRSRSGTRSAKRRSPRGARASFAAYSADVAALEESLPGFVPSTMRPALRFAARDAVRRLERKYAHLDEPGSLRRALAEIRSGLAAARCDYLLGRFSYADIAMAVVLETIAPIARTTPPLGPATKRCWSDAALAEEFSDLLSWRSRLASAASHQLLATVRSDLKSAFPPLTMASRRNACASPGFLPAKSPIRKSCVPRSP